MSKDGSLAEYLGLMMGFAIVSAGSLMVIAICMIALVLR